MRLFYSEISRWSAETMSVACGLGSADRSRKPCRLSRPIQDKGAFSADLNTAKLEIWLRFRIFISHLIDNVVHFVGAEFVFHAFNLKN